MKVNEAPNQNNANSADSNIAGKGGVSCSKESDLGGKTCNMKSVLVMISILGLTIWAYSNVIGNFFNGDDFVHLTWLKDAVANPQLVLRNFYTPWLDGTTTKFYRPLISVFMYSDYLLWGINGFGFHLTSLLFHLASTVLIFLVASRLTRQLGLASSGPLANAYAYFASAVFALYPLHPEAVSWITGRVDDIVVTFCLLSFWTFLRSRQATTSKAKYMNLAFSLIAMSLGLLSKEMAVTLPLVYAAYVFFLEDNVLTNAVSGLFKLQLPKLFSAIKSLALATLPFWMLLAVYFYVRQLALGTMVGGYDDSLFFIADMKVFIAGWVHGLRMFFVPLNKVYFSNHHFLTKTWIFSIVVLFSLAAYRAISNLKVLRLTGFVLSWLILSFIPVYKIFSIGDDLGGSRLAHLASVPLAFLLAIGLAGAGLVGIGMVSEQKNKNSFLSANVAKFSAVFAIFFCFLSAYGLHANNLAWEKSGKASNTIRANLDKLYSQLEGDPEVLFVGLPDHIDGAYTCRNALYGMTKAPQMHRDIVNCIMVNSFEPIMPFGFFKKSLAEAGDKVKIYRFDGNAFLPVTVTAGGNIDEINNTYFNKPLNEILKLSDLYPTHGDKASVIQEADGSLNIKGGSGFRGRPVFALNFENLPQSGKGNSTVTNLPEASPTVLDSSNLDCLEFVFAAENANIGKDGFDLLYKNEAVPEFELSHRAHTRLRLENQNGKPVAVVSFVLRGLPEYILGGKLSGFELRLPESCQLKLLSVKAVNNDVLMPKIDFANSGYLGNKGYLHLSKDIQEANLTYDTSAISGAKGVVFEISRPNLQFEEQNPTAMSSVLGSKMDLPGTTGNATIKREQFKSLGIYELRPWAVDADGKLLGVAGDHIVISIDS